MNVINTIAVYGASSPSIPSAYKKAAQELGTLLASKCIRLINGAGKEGVMGACSDACLAGGGSVCGIIPRFMVENGWCRKGLSELIVTKDMHERKRKMAALSDAAIALPGGCGTLEELSELITWKQLGLYAKPLVLLNTNGFYDDLIHFFQRAVNESFMRQEHLHLWQIAITPEEALSIVETTPAWDTSIRKFVKI